MLHPVVMLFDMTDGSLSLVPATTFAAAGVRERTHLQRALRAHMQILGDVLLVVAEEFGDFQDARRRIDLLCVNHEARLVVVELKRTDDGGHMELQALRYAAMVSTMTLDQLAEIYQRHLDASTAGESQDARAALAEWLEEAGGDEPVISRDARILLPAADFGRDITTTRFGPNHAQTAKSRAPRTPDSTHPEGPWPSQCTSRTRPGPSATSGEPTPKRPSPRSRHSHQQVGSGTASPSHQRQRNDYVQNSDARLHQ